jgi:cellulose synthase/poly-beta-1,6-N-acetylglucosamine synthase-like glycosyltransferase
MFESGEAVDVRIVIPAFRAEATIRDCVCAVHRAASDVAHEIMVVDDGGNSNLSGRLAGLPVVLSSTLSSGSAARARNLGAKGFTGQYLVFIDADVIIAPDCISRLLAPLRAGQAAAAVGSYSRDTAGLAFGASYKQLYVACVYGRRTGYIENEFWTAIGAIDAKVFDALRGFDGSFVGAAGEDIALGCRLSGNGYRIVAVPDAVGQHRHPLAVHKVFASDWRKGMALIAALRSSRSETKMFNNRHATSRDLLAVLLTLANTASALLALLLLSVMPLLAMPPLLLAYLVVRGDLVGCFYMRGIWFLQRAVLLMAALDLLRAACAVSGIALSVAERRGRACAQRAEVRSSDAAPWRRGGHQSSLKALAVTERN